ncbi:FtsK/SpoIIIE domain-containing protein [Streptomyces sp. M10(2022)]
MRAADVVLVIDNWAALHNADEDAVGRLTEIANRGLGVGVHLWLTANRWAEIRTSLRDSIPDVWNCGSTTPPSPRSAAPPPGCWGAACPDAAWSARGSFTTSRCPGSTVWTAPTDSPTPNAAWWHGSRRPGPGRGPGAEGAPRACHRPRTGRRRRPDPAERWEGHGPAIGAREVPVGLRESDLRPVGLDLTGGDSHFVVFGDSGAGKTAFLRSWMRGLAARHTARELRFMVVDYRHSLLDAVPDEYVGARGSNADLVAGQAQALAETLRSRMPRPT